MPVQPVVVRGTGDALPKRGFILQGRHPISIDVLEAIPPETFGTEQAEVLAEKVREILAEELGEPVQEANTVKAKASSA